MNTAQSFGARQVCQLTNITFRQLDHWDRTGLLHPSQQNAMGSGTRRLYTFEDLVQLRVIKKLLDTGMSLQRIRKAIAKLGDLIKGKQDWSEVTLVSDGETIYTLTSEAQLVDLLQEGQGVFGIAVGPVLNELGAEVQELYPEFSLPMAVGS